MKDKISLSEIQIIVYSLLYTLTVPQHFIPRIYYPLFFNILGANYKL